MGQKIKSLIISLLAALGLVLFVYTNSPEYQYYQNNRDEINRVTETLSNIPVVVNKQLVEDDVIIEGLPTTVTVQLTGDKVYMGQVDTGSIYVEAFIEQVIDDKQTVRLGLKNIPEQLTGETLPTMVVVKVQRN